MSTTVSYKGNTIATLSNETKNLTTAGTWVEGDIVVTDSGSGGSEYKRIGIFNETGDVGLDYDQYADGTSCLNVQKLHIYGSLTTGTGSNALLVRFPDTPSSASVNINATESIDIEFIYYNKTKIVWHGYIDGTIFTGTVNASDYNRPHVRLRNNNGVSANLIIDGSDELITSVNVG